jgi:Flp pilus assembly pilin Flp
MKMGMKMKAVKESVVGFWKDEEGLGTLEILLIVAVLVAIAIVFRNYIIDFFNDIMGNAIETRKGLNQEEVDKDYN